MCGKFTQMKSWGELVTLADLVGEPASRLRRSRRCRFANVIRCDPRDGAKWRVCDGFVSRDPRATRATGRSSFTPARRPSSRNRPSARPFFKRRAIVVVNTFNEGKR